MRFTGVASVSARLAGVANHSFGVLSAISISAGSAFATSLVVWLIRPSPGKTTSACPTTFSVFSKQSSRLSAMPPSRTAIAKKSSHDNEKQCNENHGYDDEDHFS